MNEGNRKGIAGQARNDGVVICNGFGINR